MSLLAVELDCCVIPIRNNLKLIQTTDFFYPLIDDPYTMVSMFLRKLLVVFRAALRVAMF